MAGVICSLLFFGRLSDQFGRARILKMALMLLALALLISAIVPGVALLMAARTVIGIGSGLLTSTATAALVDLHPFGNQKAASLTASVATITGLGVGPLLGGAIVQVAPWPLVLPYVVSAGLIMCFLLVLTRLMRSLPLSGRGTLLLRPSFRLPEPGRRAAFLGAGLAGFCGFAIIGLFASLAPSFLRDVLNWQGPVLAGAAVALLFCISGSVQLVCRGVAPRGALLLGSALMLAGMVLLALSVTEQSGTLFLTSELIAGAGQGLSFMAALAIANQLVEAQHRAASLAAFLVIVYLGGMLPVVIVGNLASRFGLVTAIQIFCAGIGMLAAFLTFASRSTPEA
jgi:predicted MFS family arabinose efflux permease